MSIKHINQQRAVSLVLIIVAIGMIALGLHLLAWRAPAEEPAARATVTHP